MDKPPQRFSKTVFELTGLVSISRAVGGDSSFVLGGSGNTSVKTADGRFMYIKASGTALKNMTAGKGWKRLKLESIYKVLSDRSIARMGAVAREKKVSGRLLAACDDRFGKDVRPSVESCFHSLLDRAVIHLHPVAVLPYLCAKKGHTELQKLFGSDRFPPLWVPFRYFGYSLAKEIEGLIKKYKKQYGRGPAVLFLQNHGLVVTAGDGDTALKSFYRTVDICRRALKQPEMVEVKVPDKQAIDTVAAVISNISRVKGDSAVQHFADTIIMSFMSRKDAAKLCSAAAVTGDELVYAGGPPMWLEMNKKIKSGAGMPAGFLVRPLGLFVVGEKKKLSLTKDCLSTYLLVRLFAADLGGINPLTKQQLKFIAKAGKI